MELKIKPKFNEGDTVTYTVTYTNSLNTNKMIGKITSIEAFINPPPI